MRGTLLASLALAVPYVAAHPTKAQGSSLSKRSVDLDAFRPKIESVYSDKNLVEETPLARRDPKPEILARNQVRRTAPGSDFRLVESYTGTNGVTHFYYKQTFNGVDVAFGDFNVNIAPDGKVLSHGSSFFEKSLFPPKGKAKKDARDALRGAVKTLGLPVNADGATVEDKGNDTFTIQGTTGTVKAPEASLVYVQNAEGKMALSWRVETDILTNWLVSFVDAENPEKVHGVVDYSADATYEVYPWGLNDPTEGERQVLTDPFVRSASEFGWHSDGTTTYQTTRGNNAIAQSNWANTNNYLSNPRPTSPNMKFEYPYSPADSDWRGYSNASITQLFYTSNKFHDLTHVLGFNERAGNFEVNNNGAGGKGNDLVILNTQDGSGMNNANFATPPDGQSGRMRMYMWDTATPFRDSSFEAGVVIHEYAHGVSNRLTGGPANSQCLSVLEAGGMGEGWGDFLATAIRLKKGDTRATDYPMGAWVNNNPRGIRAYPYSTSMTTNPHTYGDVDAITRVHGIGTVWATMLYEMMWNLIDKHGKNDADMPTFNGKVPTDGKYLAMKLVLDGMALQPCSPNFVSARNAILDADKVLTGGANKCDIWKAFAKRGLGNGAVYNATKRTTSTALPSGC